MMLPAGRGSPGARRAPVMARPPPWCSGGGRVGLRGTVGDGPTDYLPVSFSYALMTSSVGPSMSSSPFSSHSTRSQVSLIDLLL